MDTFFKTCLSSASYLLSGGDETQAGVGVEAGGHQLCNGTGKKSSKSTGPPKITSPLAYISTAKHTIHAYTNSTSLFDDTPKSSNNLNAVSKNQNGGLKNQNKGSINQNGCSNNQNAVSKNQNGGLNNQNGGLNYQNTVSNNQNTGSKNQNVVSNNQNASSINNQNAGSNNQNTVSKNQNTGSKISNGTKFSNLSPPKAQNSISSSAPYSVKTQILNLVPENPAKIDIEKPANFETEKPAKIEIEKPAKTETISSWPYNLNHENFSTETPHTEIYNLSPYSETKNSGVYAPSSPNYSPIFETESSKLLPPSPKKPPVLSALGVNRSKNAGEWVRPLGYAERFMTLSHDYGCMTTVYSLWLESQSPIEFEHIKQASVLMFRKMPNLRMHLGYNHGDLWWREMEREMVDIEEMTSDNVEETVQELLRRRYNMMEGPLWFARFVTLGDDQFTTDTNHNVKYKYVCIFGFHHNVSDGSTNMKFCQVFLKVLNDLFQGNTIDMSQEGYFATPLQDRLGEKEASIWFYIGVFLTRAWTIFLTFSHPVWNFTSYYRMPREREAGTHLLQHELNEITTSNLLKRCKMEGVTLNSAFTAAANLALYTMMLAKNKKTGLTYLCSQQAINMRRYWPKEKQSNAFGCHISLIDLSFPTQESDLDAFWEYTREVHSLLNYHLTETKLALKLQPMSVRLGILIRNNALMAKLGFCSGNDNHYTVTNMGNLTHTFPGTGPEVEVTRVLRTVACHFMPSLCQHTLQTFRGRLSYSLDFYTQKLTRETASEYALKIMDILTTSIHKPN